jgi:predicted transcriptional regulator
MPEINLTNRKTAPPKVISSHYYDESTKQYTGKFSEAYREAGHDFMKSFKVLRLVYLFQYHILNKDDVFIYETLQLLCERGIPFNTHKLAEELGIGNSTIRQCFDNLENAELLEIIQSDGQGKPNFYVLRSPLFEKESILSDTDAAISRQNRILNAGFPLPEIFIEDEYKRLLKQVKENKARKLRDVARSKELQKANPQLFREVKENKSNRLLTWYKITKKLGNAKAVTFDNLVFKLIQELRNVESTNFWQVFKARLKEYLDQARIIFDSYLLDYGVELAAFYDSRRADQKRSAPARSEQKPAAAQTKPANAPAITGNNEDAEEMREYLKATLAAVERGENLSYLPQTDTDFKKLFRDALQYLKFAELQLIAKRYFDDATWKKLTVELLT